MADVVLLERRTTDKNVAGFVCFYFLSERHVIKGRALFFLLAISTPANADKTVRGCCTCPSRYFVSFVIFRATLWVAIRVKVIFDVLLTPKALQSLLTRRAGRWGGGGGVNPCGDKAAIA